MAAPVPPAFQRALISGLFAALLAAKAAYVAAHKPIERLKRGG